MRQKQCGQKTCAFFDIDGTLVKGFIIQSFPRFLAEKGVIASKFPHKMDEIVSAYISGKASYRKVAEAVPAYYVAALKGKQQKEIKDWSKKFIKAYLPSHLLTFSNQLVHNVSELVDVTIALSGSPTEVVEEMKELAFNKFFGSTFEVENGVYTGKVSANLILGEQKADLAKRISQELRIDLRKSVAFGDTDQDVPLLSVVGLPIVLNPNKKWEKTCISRGWLRFDQKNMDIKAITDAISSIGKR
jgi:HAD superfamily hydrolase (TIGR01490 family)